jgi:hypothetical protein
LFAVSRTDIDGIEPERHPDTPHASRLVVPELVAAQQDCVQNRVQLSYFIQNRVARRD